MFKYFYTILIGLGFLFSQNTDTTQVQEPNLDSAPIA